MPASHRGKRNSSMTTNAHAATAGKEAAAGVETRPSTSAHDWIGRGTGERATRDAAVTSKLPTHATSTSRSRLFRNTKVERTTRNLFPLEYRRGPRKYFWAATEGERLKLDFDASTSGRVASAIRWESFWFPVSFCFPRNSIFATSVRTSLVQALNGRTSEHRY